MYQLLLIVLMFLISACGSPDVSENEINGTYEQKITSLAQNLFIHGTCNTRQREKCRMDLACPGGAACYIPYTKNVNYWLYGVDNGTPGEFGNGNSWKYEFKRALGSTEGLASSLSNGTWTTQEVATQAEANLSIIRGSCNPCVSANCDTMPDLVCFVEPTGTPLVESFPGPYRRPNSASSHRWIIVDIDKVEDLVPNNQTDRHYVLEHLARWATFTYAGTGSYSQDPARMPPSNDSDYWNDLMQPNSWSGDSWSDYNFDNAPHNWELCLLKNYSLTTGSNVTYTVPPVGCIN